MLNGAILAFLVGLLGLGQSVFAITFINQTDSVKIVKIEEAYRPAPDKPGNLAAPISLGYPSEKIKIAPHSIETISLKTTPSVLLISMINKTTKGKKTTTNEVMTCYEPYAFPFQDQQEEYFTDDWGFVIHKPIVGQHLSVFDPDYSSKRWALERDKEQGYGIKCLHPLLLVKVTSLEELPEDIFGDPRD